MSKKMPGTFKGSWYLRGKTKDKHGNRYNSQNTYRNNHSGFIVTEKGTFLGVERTGKHNYGSNPMKVKKPISFVRPNFSGAKKPRKSHYRRR